MILLNEPGCIPLQRNGNPSILYVIESITDGGVTKFIYNAYKYLKNRYNISVATTTDIINQSMLFDCDITAYVCSGCTMQELHNIFSNYDIVHVNNYNYKMWLNYNYPPDSRSYKIIYTYRGSDYVKKILNFPHFDDITSNRLDFESKYPFIKWFPTGFTPPNVLYESRYIREWVLSRYNIPPDAIVVSNVGRFSYIKDHNSYVEIFNGIVKRFPNKEVYGLVLGDINKKPFNSEYIDSFLGLIDKYNLRDRIILPGFRDDVYEHLIASNILLHTSLSEGVCQAINESMLCGTPVVARECINNGIHVPGYNYHPFTDIPTGIETCVSVISAGSKMLVNAFLTANQFRFDSLSKYYFVYYDNIIKDNIIRYPEYKEMQYAT